VVFISFCLLITGLVTAIGGGAFIASAQLGVNATHFVRNIPVIVTWWSVGTGVVKALTFGAIISVVACYQGYHAKGGAAGVGQTVKATAVQTLVSIIVADFALSSVSAAIHEWLEGVLW
jgi:phospholipid/cholesterol/gamma-HCH transport system permease protein